MIFTPVIWRLKNGASVLRITSKINYTLEKLNVNKS